MSDQLALEAATKIMALVYGPMPLGGSSQLKAQVQEAIADAIRASQPPALTDEQIVEDWHKHVGTPNDKYPLSNADLIQFARVIERRLLSQPKEPKA